MGLFKKTIKYSKPSTELDNKIKSLDEGISKIKSIPLEQSVSDERIDEILSEDIDLQNWRLELNEQNVEEYDQKIQEVRERHNDLIKVQGSIEYVKNKEVKQIFNELYQGEVEKVVDEYVSKYSKDIINLREDLFYEIKKKPTVDLCVLEDKVNLLTIRYNQLSEGLLNQEDIGLQDPVTFEQLKNHYQLLVGRLQEQLATLGGGGEVRLQYLDDIVGIATNPSEYDGKFLKYNHSLGKFEFVTVSGGGGGGISDIVDDTTPQLGGDLDLNGNTINGTGTINISGAVTADSFTGSGENLTNIPSSQLTGALPAIDGSALTGIVASGTGVVIQEEGSALGTASTINFVGSAVTATFSGGIATVEITSGDSGASLDDVTSNGNTTTNGVSVGILTVANKVEIRSDDSTPGRIDYYCESGNAHYTRVQAAPHSEYSGNATVILPTVSGDILIGDTASAISQNLNTTGSISANNLNVSGVTTYQGDIYLGDNDVLRFGTGSSGAGDLQIWHDTQHSYVRDNGTGNLRLKTNNMVEFVFGGTNEIMGQFIGNAGVGLYYDNSKKFETTASGVDVTGRTETDTLNVSGVSTFNDVIDCRQYITNGTVNSNISLVPNGTGAVEIGGTATITSVNPITLGGSQGIIVPGDATFSKGVNATGIVTASEFSGPNTLKERTIVSGSTTSIANNGIGNTDITGFKSYALMKVGLSTAGWLRIYIDSESRTNDASRSIGQDPSAGSGVIAEFIATGVSTTQKFAPFVMGGNMDEPVSDTIYMAITNTSGVTTSITANLTILKLEA